MRRTKVIFTFGPSCYSEERLSRLFLLADGIRLNFSHGDLDRKRWVIQRIRKLEDIHGKYVPIIGDLQGGCIRLGDFGEIRIIKGRKYKFGFNQGIIIPNKDVFSIIEEDDIVLVDDGRFRFRVNKVGDLYFIAEAEVSGVLGSKKTFLIKNKNIHLPPLTRKDLDDLRFAIDIGIEYIALSFVKCRRDLEILKRYIEEFGGDQWILAKIECMDAVNRLDEILDCADGVIVARGDLGLYFNLEEIPKVQSEIIGRSVRRGKITILATQILESMRFNPQPTRSEVADIYKAVEEGVDAIMLTGETAVGRYPVEAVSWAVRILNEADNVIKPRHEGIDESIYDKFAKGVLAMTEVIGGKLIGYSRRGNTARRISRYRPSNTVYIVVPSKDTARKINILYSLEPILTDSDNYEEAFKHALDKLKERGILCIGDIVVYTLGIREKATDMVRVEFIH